VRVILLTLALAWGWLRGPATDTVVPVLGDDRPLGVAVTTGNGEAAPVPGEAAAGLLRLLEPGPPRSLPGAPRPLLAPLTPSRTLPTSHANLGRRTGPDDKARDLFVRAGPDAPRAPPPSSARLTEQPLIRMVRSGRERPAAVPCVEVPMAVSPDHDAAPGPGDPARGSRQRRHGATLFFIVMGLLIALLAIMEARS